MTRLRFSTAQQVIDAFPTLNDVISLKKRDAAPLDFVNQLLVGPHPEEALSFLAFLLPRREAVQWLCQTLRGLAPALPPEQQAVLSTAEGWARSPSEQSRRRALEAAETDQSNGPAKWAAWAAGWSGGNMTSDDKHPVPPPPSLAGQGVKVGMVVAVAHTAKLQRPVFIRETATNALAMLNRTNA